MVRSIKYDNASVFQKEKNKSKRFVKPIAEKVYCIYHDKDLDGILSAVIVAEEYREQKFVGIPFDYGRKIDLKKIEDDSLVIMVDCSLPDDELKYLNERTMLYLFDHHYRSVNNEFCKTLNGVRMLNVSACMLVYDFFHPFGKIPPAVKLANAYDIWDTENQKVWNEEVLPFQYGMKQFALNPNLHIYSQILHCKNDIIKQIMAEGEVIMRFEKIQAQEMMNRFSYTAEIQVGDNKYKALVINRQLVSSDYFVSALNKNYHHLCVGYQEKQGKYTYSLRSWKGGCDVREIAKFFDPFGGGHKYAAGFTSTKNIFIQ